jgi:phthalate 4,5-dioxygenase oxygenase subunit
VLSDADNEFLCQVGPGTPMGNMMRRYWLPALLPSELPAPDCPPVRVRLLGEDLVAFRDSDGQVGLLGAHCPHRGASLFFGRNEECGLRCVYHGWKFDLHGSCVDMPNEPPESNFKDKIHHVSYPCREDGGVVWAYMGPTDTQPDLPELESNLVPDTHRLVSKRLLECNYAQTLEGGIDPSHTSFLHSRLGEAQSANASAESADAMRYLALDRHPQMAAVDTDYGVLIGARRDGGEELDYWRVNVFLMPLFTMAPSSGEDPISRWSAWVPMDDEKTLRYIMMWHPRRPLTVQESGIVQDGTGMHLNKDDLLPPASGPAGAFRSRANRENDYLIDREAQRTVSFSGIKGFGTEDQAVTESMGPIFERSGEHLGSSDLGIIATRRRLLNAAKRLREHGEPPTGVLSPSAYRVRSTSVLLPKGADWVDSVKDRVAARPGVNPAQV